LEEKELLAKGKNISLPALKGDPASHLAVLQYTGGTTGRPKGAMLSHANLSINVMQLRYWAPMLEDGRERILAILPFFHVFAMTTILNYGMAGGAEIILMPRFEIGEALRLIDQTRPTILPGVPTLFAAFVNHPGIAGHDLSSLKFCISGGAGLPHELRERFEKLTGGVLIEGYGLSETSPVLTANPVGGERRKGSIGLPLPATTISIRSLEAPDKEMPQGEKGEICAAGPQVMMGYWRRERANEESFAAGCFRTGDIGYVADDGFIYMADRLKDMINASGYKIWPRHIEDALYKMPQIEEAAVIGVKDEYRGEAPKAFIRLREGQSLSAKQVLDFLKGHLSKLELPAAIEFRHELPKTMIGKISRKKLREEEEAGTAGAAQEAQDEAPRQPPSPRPSPPMGERG
jgi:long-chain acyl-CoA synthetase